MAKSDLNLNKQNNNKVNNLDVVYEDEVLVTPQDKIKNYISTINIRAVIAIAIVCIVILAIIILILANISKTNASYKSNILVPNIIYMGETANISVEAEGKNQKNLNQTTTTFKTEDTNIISILNEEIKGNSVFNTIIPIQEGKATIKINSKLQSRTMANETKEVTVCPAFNLDLLLIKNIYLLENSKHDMKIDFGEAACGEKVEYSSTNENVAAVSNEGIITGVKEGKTIITISKGTRTISVPVSVVKTNKYITSMTTVNKIQMEAGDITRLKIDYKPVDATLSTIALSVDDSKVATVSSGGKITAVGVGTTKVHVRTAFGPKLDIDIIVTDKKQSTTATKIELNKTEVTLSEGKSEKIVATVTPDTASNKNITWKSSNENIATVNQNGVIYAKKEGQTTIIAATGQSASETVKVTVTKMQAPVITASDNIESNKWHNTKFELNFSGSDQNSSYYYGKTENQITTKASKVEVSSDGTSTYYVKSCTTSCEEKCKEEKNKTKAKECTTSCSKNQATCSQSTSYIAKLDTNKPQIQTVVVPSSASNTATVQIAIRDNTSGVARWCITTSDNSLTCKWNNIQISNNPVVSSTLSSNGEYYAFAEDAAGNISKSYKFQISNIQ